jgi:hypothetical protein
MKPIGHAETECRGLDAEVGAAGCLLSEAVVQSRGRRQGLIWRQLKD